MILFIDITQLCRADEKANLENLKRSEQVECEVKNANGSEAVPDDLTTSLRVSDSEEVIDDLTTSLSVSDSEAIIDELTTSLRLCHAKEKANLENLEQSEQTQCKVKNANGSEAIIDDMTTSLRVSNDEREKLQSELSQLNSTLQQFLC
ncbi:hypothetical protein B566_EDAN007100, partial [Ephemera danica]